MSQTARPLRGGAIFAARLHTSKKRILWRSAPAGEEGEAGPSVADSRRARFEAKTPLHCELLGTRPETRPHPPLVMGSFSRSGHRILRNPNAGGSGRGV